jgi:hypothetical protein
VPEYFGGTAFCAPKHDAQTVPVDPNNKQADLLEEQEAQSRGGDEGLSDAQISEQDT